LAKQLILYMAKKDEAEFLEYVRSGGRLAILPASSPTSDFPRVRDLPEPSEDDSTRKFWLHNLGIDLPLITEYDPENDHYVIDGFQSPVVEFIRSLEVSRILLPGRIQADMNYIQYEKQDLVQKPHEFRIWFESMENWIRRRYTHLTLLTYAGPGAEEFREQGGLFH